MARKLRQPLPYDLDQNDLRVYKQLTAQWQDWQVVGQQCQVLADNLARALLKSQLRSTDTGLEQ